MKVIYSTNYMLRDLYVLEYKGKYIMVYRSSGLNAGRKGRFLPFEMLGDPKRTTLSSVTPGYIYKEFYFDKSYRAHHKDPQRFGEGIGEFLLEIEEFLSDKVPEQLDQDYIQSYQEVQVIARAINIELKRAIEGFEPFDWKDL